MCRLDSFPHALLPIRRKISTAPPRCSPDTRLSINREDVYPENNKVALTKSCVRSGGEHIWGNEPNLHILGLSMDNVGQFERIQL
jgi:hypothetical protein